MTRVRLPDTNISVFSLALQQQALALLIHNKQNFSRGVPVPRPTHCLSERRVDSSFLVLSLSSHRYQYVSLLFNPHFIDSQ
jgi:hypothetical protein